jgi:hypothetical protein
MLKQCGTPPVRGLIHLSDQGYQNTPPLNKETNRLELYGMTCGMSRKGDCWDKCHPDYMAIRTLRQTSAPISNCGKKAGFEGKISKRHRTICFLVYFVPRQLRKRCSWCGNISITTRIFPETETFMLMIQFF